MLNIAYVDLTQSNNYIKVIKEIKTVIITALALITFNYIKSLKEIVLKVNTFKNKVSTILL